jgi:molecular chaperone GrpE
MSDEVFEGAAGDQPSPAITPDQDAAEATAEVVEHDIEALLAERNEYIAERNEYIAERNEYKDIALRLQADFENYRKRAATQLSDDVDRATGKLAEALLPVLDACEAAFSHGVEGVEPVWSALIGVLQKQGLEALDLQGQVFDPALAEAVMHEPDDGTGNGETMVTEVLRTGYRWKGRVLRAAMVKVKG